MSKLRIRPYPSIVRPHPSPRKTGTVPLLMSGEVSRRFLMSAHPHRRRQRLAKNGNCPCFPPQPVIAPKVSLRGACTASCAGNEAIPGPRRDLPRPQRSYSLSRWERGGVRASATLRATPPTTLSHSPGAGSPEDSMSRHHPRPSRSSLPPKEALTNTEPNPTFP
jgi:hypothetical protein